MDPDYRDGLLNVSGNIVRQEVRGQIEPFLRHRKSPDEVLPTDASPSLAARRSFDKADIDKR
jgi:hypothetical protein